MIKAPNKRHFTITVLAIATCIILSACSPATTGKWDKPNIQKISPNTLVGHWRFDESSGTVALDSAAQKNNGTLVGSPTWSTTGLIDGALFFDGKNDYVALGNDSLNIASEFTLSLWLNFEKSNNYYQTLIQRGKYVYPFMLQLAANRIRTAVRTTQGKSSDTHYLLSITELAEKRWYHVAITYQNGKYILYVNGKEENRKIVSGELVLGNHPTNIGAQQAGLNHLHGLLDDIRIYNSALNPQQVQAIFKAQNIPTTTVYVKKQTQKKTTQPNRPALTPLRSTRPALTLPRSTRPAEWRVMPVRSKEEFQQGKPGGEAEQHPHSISRCLNHPEIIYFSQDVAGVWRSKNSGETWEKTLDRGLWVNQGQSIEVDPVAPKTLFLISDNNWNFLGEKYQGLYRSSNGGDDWEFVLPVQTNYTSNHHRMYRHNIAYDPTTITSAGAKRWYAAFPASQPDAKETDDGGLYRSEDMGITWTSMSKLPGHSTVYAIQPHPTDSKTIYLASNRGLFISHARGKNLKPLGQFSEKQGVSSIAINPQNPQIIYVTLFEKKKVSWGVRKVGKGLYRSLDGGTTFSQLKSYDAARVFMNPGHPEVLYLVGNYSNTIVSHDGGQSWFEKLKATATPGLARGYKKAITGELAGIVANPKNPDEAVAFSQATLWKTTDGGKTFKESSSLFTGYAWAWYNTALAFDAFDPQRLGFFNLDVGMTLTTTGTDYFVWRNQHAWDWYSTIIDNGKGKKARLIPWMGTNSGSFQPIPGSQVVVASIGRYFITLLMRSEDSGRTWELVQKRKEGEIYRDLYEMNEFVAFHPKAPNVVYAGNKISDDAGRTFVDIDFGSFGPAKILGMCLSQPDTVYAMHGYMLKILRSDDRGKTWRLYSAPGWQFKKLDRIPTFAVDPVDPDLVYSIDEKGDLALFDGLRWYSTGVLAQVGGLEVGNFVRTIAIDPNHPEVIYAGMFASGRSGIWRSIDGGENWEDISNNLPRIGQHTMAVSPHTGELFTGSVVGTWVFPPPYESKNLIYDKLISVTDK